MDLRHARTFVAVAELGTVSKAALPLLSPETRKWQPDMSKSHVVLNDLYWADNYPSVSARFKLWMLS